MFVYGYHNTYKLWKQISHLPNTNNNPWFIISDLNELSNPMKKHLLVEGAQLDIQNLICLFEESLIDLGHIGNSFTWHNKRKVEKAVFTRLSHAQTNHHWINLYPNPILTNLPLIGYDCAPIYLVIAICFAY